MVVVVLLVSRPPPTRGAGAGGPTWWTYYNALYYYTAAVRIQQVLHLVHYIISKSDILEINCSNIALLEKCISQDTEPLQGAYDKI